MTVATVHEGENKQINTSPTTNSILKSLKQAQKETEVVLTIEGKPNIVRMDESSHPENYREGLASMKRYMDEGVWRTDGLGFQRLKEWVDTHWNTADEQPAPSGTVATNEYWMGSREGRLDAVTATKKLIVAAKLYGPEQIRDHAIEFAACGMVEITSIYLLKGSSVDAAKHLDRYCTLLPYQEALEKIHAESEPGDLEIAWPEPHTNNICGLEVRHFENRNPKSSQYGRYTSPLLKGGPEQLVLLLGLVWGSGFRVFAGSHGIPATVAATLPYQHASSGRSGGFKRVALTTLPRHDPQPRQRPLAINELRDLGSKYLELPEQARSKLERAMKRLRKSTERADHEDKAMDLGIALKILFIEEDEQIDQAVLMPQRAAWYYADSEEERRQTEDMLDRFHRYHLEVVHGRRHNQYDAVDQEHDARVLRDADDVLRASLKTMIAQEWPKDWTAALKQTAFRTDPQRAESEIPSVKSDSLSWSVEDLRHINQALEDVWKPVVEEAPPPPSNVPPSIISSLQPELIESYREHGIPYVVIHPARLYEAHPKWPKTVSDPLDECIRYYCEKDVERHASLWREAALRKDLIQFEVPTDADMYHPKSRHDWPQPLLSSHEDELSIRMAGQGSKAGQPATSHGKMTDAERPKHSGVEEKSAMPPAKLPKHVISDLARERSRLWYAFQHDVNVVTNSLLYMLNAIHELHLAERQRLDQSMIASGGGVETLDDAVQVWGDTFSVPAYPSLRAYSLLAGEPLFERTKPGGRMEQTLFKGWIYEVYNNLWESRYRGQLKNSVQNKDGAIRPRTDAIGDLGRIRGDLLHNNSIAKKSGSTRCRALRWFTHGERMRVRPWHVFDFLNHMGWLADTPILLGEDLRKSSCWHINSEGEPEKPTPALVSVRPVVDQEAPDPVYRYAAAIAFENGVFGAIPMGRKTEESNTEADDSKRKWMEMMINEAGDLEVPGFETVAASTLYWACLKGEKTRGPGIWGPAIRVRE